MDDFGRSNGEETERNCRKPTTTTASALDVPLTREILLGPNKQEETQVPLGKLCMADGAPWAHWRAADCGWTREIKQVQT